MKVYVVMGNDFPEVVFSKEEEADAFCVEKKKEKGPDGRASRIYWRTYEFTVMGA